MTTFSTRSADPLTEQPLDSREGLLKHYVRKILAAPVYDVAIETPLQPARQSTPSRSAAPTTAWCN
jgi:threonine dehydratase